MSQNHKVGEQGEAGSEPATFWEHLDVLRGEIIRMLAAAVLMAVVCFCLKDVLFEIVLAPSRSDFIVYRLLGTEPFDIHLINTGLTEQMMVLPEGGYGGRHIGGFTLSALSAVQVRLACAL